MKISPFLRWSLPAAILILEGCADLSNIRKFAAVSADSASYTTFVTDYEKSAERLKAYEPPAKAAQLDSTIAIRKAQQKPLLGLLAGIQAYLNALGALASDQLVTYDQSLGSVTEGLKATKAVSDQQAAAFDALSKLVARAATDAYRQAKLKAVIREANPHFQKLMAAVRDIVGKDFAAALDTEKAGADNYFKDVIETARHAPPQDAAIELVKEALHERDNELDQKRAACLVYAKTLDTVAKGHQALFDQVDKLTSAEILGTIDAYATSVAQLLKQLNQLK